MSQIPSKGDSSREMFNPKDLLLIAETVQMAEELVSDHFKMSASEWLRPRYDVKTLTDLSPEEIVDGPFAQIIRYLGKPHDRNLGSAAYDFYKICLQDHAILKALHESSELGPMPFLLYIITHELIHIVRFSKFIQRFDASETEKQSEEIRVHGITHEILKPLSVEGLDAVFQFYRQWHSPLEALPSSNDGTTS